MSDQNEVVVQFKAVVADFLDKMGAAHKGTADAAEKITSSVHGIGAGFEKLMTTIGALSAVLAGGALFKEAISETVDWSLKVERLSTKVGITTEKASGLALALHRVGMDTGEYSTLVNKLTRQMRANGGAFDEMGIKTKDSNGEWRNSQSVMMDTIEKLNGMKTGADRNVAAQAMFGGRIGDLNKLLRLNGELIEEETRKTEKLNLVVGPDGAAQAHQYQEAMADLHADMLGLSVGVGSALIPVLSKLTENLATVLMPVVKVVGTIFAALGDIFGVLVDCVGDLWNTVSGAIKEAFEPLSNLFGGDLFTGANLLKVVLGTIETVIIGITLAVKMLATLAVTAFENMVTSAMAFGRAIKAVFTGDFQGAVAAAKDANDKIEANNKKAMDKIVADAMAANQKIQAVWGDKPEPKKSKEPGGETTGGKDFKAGKKEKTNVVAEWEAELQKQKAMLTQSDGDLAEMSKEDERAFWTGKLALTKQGSAEWVQIRLKMAEDGKAIQKAQDDEAKKAEKQTSDLAKLTRQDEMAAAKNAIEVKRANLAAAVQMGQITHAQELAELKKFHAEELKIEIDALLAEQVLHKDDPVKFAEIQNRILAAKRKSNLDIQKINTQAAQEEMKTWTAVAGAITNSLGNALQSLLTKTKSFAGAVQGLFQSLAQSFSKLAMDMAMEWVKGEMIKKAASVSSATTQATGNAVVAGSGAAASAASIPVYGWAIALAAGAAVLAGVMGMKSSIGSAQNGWDIPAGLNPMAQLHEEEMVLPKEQANVIRDMAKGGGGAPIQLKGVSAGKFFIANQKELLGVINEAVRNGRRS